MTSRNAGPRRSTEVAAVAVGGALGAAARHAAQVQVPPHPGSFGWAVLVINVTGCLLLGLFAGSIAAGRVRHPLARPFVGVGVLGGFTTFSAFTLDAHQLVDAGAVAAAVAYVALTVAGCLLATAAGLRLATVGGTP